MKKVVLLATPDLPCPGSHLLHTRKFLSAFEYFGYKFLTISSLDDLVSLDLQPDDFVYVSDHGVSTHPLNASQLHVISELARLRVVPIFWYWIHHVDLLDSLFQDRWILTGEHFRSATVLESHAVAQSVFSIRRNFIPLRFAADRRLLNLSTEAGTRNYRASFVGHRYKRNINRLLRCARRRIRIRYTPPFIDEQSRIDYFTSSKVTLGWHSDGNISNGVVVERVFEGLALGSIVVSDNPYAVEATDGLAIYVDGLDDTLAAIDRAWSDETFCRKYQSDAARWIREHGTYANVVQPFLSFLK